MVTGVVGVFVSAEVGLTVGARGVSVGRVVGKWVGDRGGRLGVAGAEPSSAAEGGGPTLAAAQAATAQATADAPAVARDAAESRLRLACPSWNDAQVAAQMRFLYP